MQEMHARDGATTKGENRQGHQNVTWKARFQLFFLKEQKNHGRTLARCIMKGPGGRAMGGRFFLVGGEGGSLSRLRKYRPNHHVQPKKRSSSS